MSGPEPEHQQPRTSGFCFNCCAPLDADVTQQAHCHVCGADPHSQHLLQPDSHAKDAAAAGAALKAARLAAAEAGVPGVAHTLLVYQEEGEEDAAMLQHRSLLPPAPERPERIKAILGQLRTAGLLGGWLGVGCGCACIRMCHHTPRQAASCICHVLIYILATAMNPRKHDLGLGPGAAATLECAVSQVVPKSCMLPVPCVAPPP
jgi:hypothetical protein